MNNNFSVCHFILFISWSN